MGAPLSPRLAPQSSAGATSRNFTSSSLQLDEKELFSNLQKPRVRYDVEVVTKLIVYSGIAWLATEGNPILFDTLGLSV